MGFHRVLADKKIGGDFAVGVTASHQGEDVQLPGGQAAEQAPSRLRGPIGSAGVDELGDEPTGGGGREQAFAAGHLVDAPDQVLGGYAFEEEAGRPRV